MINKIRYFVLSNLGKIGISCWFIACLIAFNHSPVKHQKPECDSICIGGYQYELVVNEFNEPVWCGENVE